MRSRVMRSVSQAPTPSVTLHTINKIHKKHTQTNKTGYTHIKLVHSFCHYT